METDKKTISELLPAIDHIRERYKRMSAAHDDDDSRFSIPPLLVQYISDVAILLEHIRLLEASTQSND